MTSCPPETAEASLFQAYQAEAEHYARALRLAQTLRFRLQQGASVQEEMTLILACLDDVRTIEARIAETRTQWQQSGRKPGPELSAALNRVAELLASLAPLIGAAEKQALTRLGELRPQLDASSRARQMQHAYLRSRA